MKLIDTDIYLDLSISGLTAALGCGLEKDHDGLGDLSYFRMVLAVDPSLTAEFFSYDKASAKDPVTHLCLNTKHHLTAACFALFQAGIGPDHLFAATDEEANPLVEIGFVKAALAHLELRYRRGEALVEPNLTDLQTSFSNLRGIETSYHLPEKQKIRRIETLGMPPSGRQRHHQFPS